MTRNKAGGDKMPYINVHKSEHGFTLIELIIVIIILGIMAVIAIPKFTNLSSSARIASVNGLKGALSSGANIVHAQAIVKGVDSGSQVINIKGRDIQIRSGYPRVAGSCTTFTGDLTYWIDMDIDNSICNGGSNADWYGYVSKNEFYFMPAGFTNINEKCYVSYRTASQKIGNQWVDTDSAEITATTDGC